MGSCLTLLGKARYPCSMGAPDMCSTLVGFSLTLMIILCSKSLHGTNTLAYFAPSVTKKKNIL